MGTTQLETLKATQIATFGVFLWGSQSARIVSGTSGVVVNTYGSPVDGTYSSVPSFEVRDLTQGGGTDDRPLEFRVKSTVSPFDVQSLGQIHAPVSCRIGLYDPDSPSNTFRTLFAGRVAKITRNPSGNAGAVRVLCESLKARMGRISLGLRTTTTCQWRFASAFCGATQQTASGTITGIGADGATTLRMTIATPPTVANYARGWLDVDGAVAEVAEVVNVSGTTYRVSLRRVPPAGWVGETATLKSGCDKTRETCETRYNNLANFNAPGHSIPAYNPSIAIS
jgi:hypothetical protein